jgi:hypothetical protein
VAVLQGWSKSTNADHLVGLAFMGVFAAAPIWGLRTFARMASKKRTDRRSIEKLVQP